MGNKTNMDQKYRAELIKEIKKYAQQLKELYIEKLTDNNITATDNLIQNMESYTEEISPHIYVAGLKLLDYWQHIENGRDPGRFPPLESIANWISTRQITPQPYELPNGRIVIPTEQQLAFLIGRKIAQEGIPARPYLQESVEELQELINTIVNDVTKNAVAKVIQQVPKVEI